MPKTKSGLVNRALTWLHHHRFVDLHGVHNWSGGGWGGGWWPGAILEANTGDWQRNIVTAPTQTLLANSAVYACITGIASDVAKMRIMLVENDDGIWEEVTQNQPWLPLLRNPNHFQNHIQFIESWLLSKLMYGNTYVLKQRDARGVVNRLYVMHPGCVKPLVAENGDIYYKLTRDDLSRVTDARLEELIRRYGETVIPESEIIHDRINPLWHPLVGVSPLYACAASATMGNSIQTNSTKFFGNRSLPSGILTAPGEIADETAARLKTDFEANFGGDNFGRIAVLGDALTFVPLTMKAEDAQLIEQLKWTVEDVARAFRYPLWKLGGPTPPYTKPDQAQTMYYSDCLQSHIEQIEKLLDDGLELGLSLGTEFDLDGLLRMDTAALYESINLAKNWMTPNEQRRRANLPPVAVGGDTIYKQEQDHSIEAIARRDEKEEMEPPDTGPEPTATLAAPERDFDIDEFSIQELRRELTLV